MTATATTAKFNVAYLSPAKSASSIPPIHPDSFFDWTTLSTTILRGQGFSRSASVSPSTARNDSRRDFQCGRSSRAILSRPALPEEEDFIGTTPWPPPGHSESAL